MTSGDDWYGYQDENGLVWCVEGGAAAVDPAWFTSLLTVASAGDTAAALRSLGFEIEDDEPLVARNDAGLRVLGAKTPGTTTALCYWEDCDPEFALSAAVHAGQQTAFLRAYEAVRAAGVAALGEPTMDGIDPADEDDPLEYRWSLWRIGEAVLAVHQAAGDVQFGVSVQLDTRRHPEEVALAVTSPFVDWMWQ